MARMRPILSLATARVAFGLAMMLFATGAWGQSMADMPAGADHHMAPAADSFQAKYDFFTNFGTYMPRVHCLIRADGTTDWPWISILLALNITVIVGYLKIFRFWRQCYLAERPEDRHTKLMDLAVIFLLCATCGYGFFILTIFWPAYRLQAAFMVALSIVTWRFAFDLDSFRISFSAKRLQRELNEHLQRRNDELAELVERRTRDLEQADSFKRMFLSNLSHELRTPMSAILGFADMLSDRTLEPVQFDGAVVTIQRNGKHLLALLNDVLDLSKIEAGKVNVERVPCNVDEIACDVVRLLSHQASEQGVTLSAKNVTPVPQVVHTDPLRLRQILTNLVGNALKFTPRGSVTVEIAFYPAPDGASGRLSFVVIDTGCGIAPEALERVFEPFVQAGAPIHGGTGLGLTISRSLARMLGGDLTAASLPGKGSRFTLSIDAGEVTAVMASLPSEVVPANATLCQNVKPLQGKHVLVAEDAPDAQLLLRHLLRNWGAESIVVDNGSDAFEQAVAQSDKPFDAILMDMQMPVMDGLAATQKIRASGVELPIIMLTANAMAGDRERCITAGCTDYAAKPVDPNLLLNTIVAALDHYAMR